MLDDAGFPNAKIIASNDLDEYTIMNLKQQGAKIDSWGIGTKLITGFDQPALGAVYKIVSIEDEEGNMVDTIKISANPEKVSTPGLKKVFRIINLANQKSEGDYITLDHENPNEEKILHMFHPTHTYLKKDVKNFEAKDLHQDIFTNGQLVYQLPKIQAIQKYSHNNLNYLWDEYKRSLNPAEYPVDLSPSCWENKRRNIELVSERVRSMTNKEKQ